MTDLLTLAREHDLPPKWDGVKVEWRGWKTLPTGRVFICPPPKEPDCCKKCGSMADSLINRGIRKVWLAGKDRFLDMLMVYRCSDCKHDVVHVDADDGPGEWWDLDHTDYGDQGSA